MTRENQWSDSMLNSLIDDATTDCYDEEECILGFYTMLDDRICSSGTVMAVLNTGAALDVEELDEPWAAGLRTRIHADLFAHITTATNR